MHISPATNATAIAVAYDNVVISMIEPERMTNICIHIKSPDRDEVDERAAAEIPHTWIADGCVL